MKRSNEEIRSVDFTATSVGADGRTLEGYAAVYDQPAEIDSPQEGHFTETIQRGAFGASIALKVPALLFDHGRHPQIGAFPLGKITDISEDSRGLHVRARLTRSSLVEPVRAAIADGSIGGMSVRMNVSRDAWAANRSARTITEASLVELGPVPFPAYEATSVGVRSRALTIGSGRGLDPVRRRRALTLLRFGIDIDELGI